MAKTKKVAIPSVRMWIAMQLTAAERAVGVDATLDRLVREGLLETMTFRLRLEKQERA